MMRIFQSIIRRHTRTDNGQTVYAVSVLGEGETVWQAGYWDTYNEAESWISRNDPQIDSLVEDYGLEFNDVEVVIVVVNNHKKMHKMGWNK